MTTAPTRCPALALATLAALVIFAEPARAMPGGFGGTGFMVVFVGLLGAFLGYIWLLLVSIYHALKEGPRRTTWRIVAAGLLAFGALVAWRILR
jgi:membrane-bound ClpP family serine protease